MVDSLNIEEWTPEDKALVEKAMKDFHNAKEDSTKIGAFSGICNSMMHSDWQKYQFYQYKLIKKTFKNHQSPSTIKYLKIALASALNNIGYIYNKKGVTSKALAYYHKSFKIQEEIGNKKGIAAALNNIGFIYQGQGEIPKALEYFHRSIKVQEEIGNKKGIAAALNNIGLIYKGQGEIPKALEYYDKSLKIQEEIGDKRGIAIGLNNIGIIYDDQGDIPKALEYQHKSLKIREEIGDEIGIANSLNNIGYIYDDQGDDSKALEYYYKSLKIREEIGNKIGIAMSYNNIGGIYDDQGDDTKALEYLHKSLKIQEEIGNKEGIAKSLNNIGGIEIEIGGVNNLASAKQHLLKALDLGQEIGYPSIISVASGSLSSIYEKQGKGMEALEMYKLHVQMKDSINNEETQKATIRQQTKYEFEKAQIVKENEAKEEARLESEATGRRNNIQYSLIFLGILILFVGILMLGFIKVSPNVAEGIIFFAFLILFEFVLVFSEPYLEQYTNGEPMYNLLANSVLALLIFPVHAILEKLLKKRIVKV